MAIYKNSFVITIAMQTSIYISVIVDSILHLLNIF